MIATALVLAWKRLSIEALERKADLKLPLGGAHFAIPGTTTLFAALYVSHCPTQCMHYSCRQRSVAGDDPNLQSRSITRT